MKIFENIEDLIGNTPLYRLKNIEKLYNLKNTRLWAKLEGQNIGASIKDRVALALIKDLEKKGLLNKSKTIVEPSSGNTGIGLAMIAGSMGYKVKIYLPETATPERTQILKFFGAEVDYCSAEEWKGNGALEKIKKIVAQNPNFIMPNQYENPINVDAHYHGTGKEIFQQLPEITHLSTSIGTGGTITGIAKRLKEEKPSVKILGAEIRTGSKIPGPRSLETFQAPVLDLDLIDERMPIELDRESEVFDLHKKIAQKEGLLCGISSAAALYTLLKKAKNIDAQDDSTKNMVAVFPDRGEKYLSTLLS